MVPAGASAFTASDYAQRLRVSLGLSAQEPWAADPRSADVLWADSGAMALTGYRDGPALLSPAPLAACAQGAWRTLASLSDGMLDPWFAAYRLLGERAALMGLQRNGAVSAGGACRLLRVRDGCIALNLPREDDWRLLPAWLETAVADWDTVADCVIDRELAPLLERARLLGLAAASSVSPPSRVEPWFRLEERGLRRRSGAPHAPMVLDLGSLWAAPLCTNLLGMLGARVVKVESEQRLDGARFGPAAFFDVLNAGKESVMLDLRTPAGRNSLRSLLASADIVVESARPRALEQMGIRAADLVAAGTGKTWIAITGHGRGTPQRDWIAYGDDAGVAAGFSELLRCRDGQPVFCADAVADPLTGLHAAVLAWHGWRSGSGGLFDVSLYAVAAHCAALHVPVCTATDGGVPVAAPVARPVSLHAAAPGADTVRVLREFAHGRIV
ncbi:MAG: CoA transferase [Pseudomonadales bacterium]|jgi:hypothetical protein|nr:CoA transferase [Pseudomonadales bacterium]